MRNPSRGFPVPPPGLPCGENARVSTPGVGRPEEDTQANAPYLVPLLSGRTRVEFALLCALWVGTLLVFWSWWLQPAHNQDLFRYGVNCAILFWTTVIPGYFLLIYARAHIPNPARTVPPGLRVAMVVTKAPSEPFELVRRTLLAMLAQRYPHDTWLADEDPSAETLAWCADHGVQVSTRKGVAAYHNPSWPRRTRCKEGNLAYFYDHYGYERYDFVAQLDADHVPADAYLEAMLLPFADARVGYVSAPSICDSNAAASWSARGRLHVEGALHGALQAGHNGGLAPLCIGSHYAVRTAALRDIGGLGPELAEDHSTTLMMNAKGWRGVHALDAIASGEGPRTFADMVTQEYQWSKSLAMLLFRYTPRYFGTLPLRLKAQFLFAQLWYPLFSLTMAASVLLPVFALLTGQVWANVEYLSYLAYATAVTGTILLLMAWVKSTGTFRPSTAKVASWEGFMFLFVRWPWSLLGTGSALVDWLRGQEFVFRVTPKTAAVDARPPMRVVLPYLLISLWCSVPLVVVDDPGNAHGFYVISMFNGLMYLFAGLLIVVAHARENGQGSSLLRPVLGDGPMVQRALFVAAALVLVAGISLRLSEGTAALLWQSEEPARAAAIVPTSYRQGSGQATQPAALGAYDPQGEFNNSNNLAIDHVFISWTSPTLTAEIVQAYRTAAARNRWLMVSVEPWPWQERHNEDLLADVLEGYYDAQIRAICRSLASLNAPMFVRWGHEMEGQTGRYPWANGVPSSYIRSYRKFVAQCRSYTNQLYFVWSPSGEPSLGAYFPGKRHVDFIGLSVYDCLDCGLPPAGGIYSALNIFEVKYQRIKSYGLPIMIAELGINGSIERRRHNLRELMSSLPQYPLLKSVIYFNAVDTPGAWPVPVPPNWRLGELVGEFRHP